jgi:carbon-monoxide dehydrogenase medium subunit
MNNPISYVSLPEFNYFSPHSLENALELLDKYQDECKILAGGTDLLIDMRHRLITPKTIIDIKNLPELKKLEFNQGKKLIIGAAVPIAKILELQELKEHYCALYQALNDMCDELLRWRATIGGNIGTASPAADSIGPLYVYQATVEIQSLSNGKRRIPIQKFFTGVKESVLKPNELVTNIIIPIPQENTKAVFKKMKRVSEDLALVGVTGLKSKDAVYFAYTAMAPTPIFKDITAKINRTISFEELFKSIWDEIKSNLKPISDVRASKEYRMHIAEVLTLMILKEIL